MEVLNVLEKKIAGLIELIKELKIQNIQLTEQNAQLKHQLETLENSLLSRHQNIEEMGQERALTKLVVDDLIKNIDLLIEQEPR